VSNWRDALRAEHLLDRERAYTNASHDAVAFREAEYDRICPRWREFKAATCFLMGRGSLSGPLGLCYLERRPYDGAWNWDATVSTHASRFTLEGAVAMQKRLDAFGIRDSVIVPKPSGDPTVTEAQAAAGELEMNL